MLPITRELSNIAIAIVKQTESTIFVEFPGSDSFETVVNTITRGSVKITMSNFSVSLHRVTGRFIVDRSRLIILHSLWNYGCASCDEGCRCLKRPRHQQLSSTRPRSPRHTPDWSRSQSSRKDPRGAHQRQRGNLIKTSSTLSRTLSKTVVESLSNTCSPNSAAEISI